MTRDPIVAEVRHHRDAYAKRFNYNIEAICRDIRAKQAKSDKEVVSLPPKLVPKMTEKQEQPESQGQLGSE